MTITVNGVRNLVIQALEQRFPNMPVFGEEVAEEPDEPYFYVNLFAVAMNRELDRRYKRSHSFNIILYGVTIEGMHDIAEQLYEQMEYINVDNYCIRGHKMRHEMVDRQLHFFIDYDIHVMREKRVEPVMQKLKQEGMYKL